MALNRRGFLIGVGGVAACAAPLANGRIAVRPSEGPAVAPPGSGGFDRLKRLCTGCNLCVARCPTKVLKAAKGEYGLEGVMMPVMDFRAGFCDPDCTRCGEACPTGAIRPFARAAKRTVRIGLAAVDHAKCLSASGRESCGLCSRHCPYGALSLKKADKRERPVVDPAKCVGCGACAHVCPVTAIGIRPVGQDQVVSSNEG